MLGSLSFAVDWTDAQLSPTAARLKIDIAGNNACRAENHWSRSVDDAVHLDAMPLGLWLAGSWWRLRWEGRLVDGTRPATWRMSHEIAAAGGGFLWPNVIFSSDGETIHTECQPSDSHSREVIRYISSFEASISAHGFEAGVDAFINLILERVSGGKTDLKDLWAEVVDERANPDVALFRRLEAMIGFDPDEAPPALMEMLAQLTHESGQEAASEIAAICGGSDPDAKLKRIMDLGREDGVVGHLENSFYPALVIDSQDGAAERGRHLAQSLRRAAGIQAEAVISDPTLGDFLGLKESQLTNRESKVRKPLAMMISGKDKSEKFVFRDFRYITSRRFEAARLLCDGLMRPGDEWHPSTDADTARQKVQRSFAAEFLAPVSGLRRYLNEDFSMDAIEGAAEYYDVSPFTVGSQLVNNGEINRNHPVVRMLAA
jgi:hypothetical protein